MDRNVLIFGASRGIGRATTLEFAKLGDHLSLVSRNKELLEELAKECVELGAKSVKIYYGDVMEIDNQKFAHKLLDEHGHFDVVVHCIGTSLTSRDVFGGEKDWLYALRLNALHAIDINSVIIPHMIDNNIKGKIIHVSSTSAKMLRGNPLYASSKAFLNAYVTTTGREVASKGICLNSVMPGAVSFEGSYWDQKMKSYDPAALEFLKQHQAINRFGTAEEIAKTIVFLASDDASFYCGCNIPLDGGNM